MFEEQISFSRNYLRHIRKEIYLSFFIFLAASLFGYLFAQFFPNETNEYISQIEQFFDSMDQSTYWNTFFSIFENNASAMIRIVCLGLFVGFFSFTFLLVNGFVLGLMAHVVFFEESWILFFAGIVPHGIIEIPCMLFSAAIGLKIGFSVIRKIIGRKVDLTQEVARGLEFSVVIIFPLLFIAAAIETYLTPIFMAFSYLFY